MSMCVYLVRFWLYDLFMNNLMPRLQTTDKRIKVLKLPLTNHNLTLA